MCGGTKYKQSNKVTKNTTIGAVVSGRNTTAGGWWWWLGTDCWVVRRNNCFLAATVVEDAVHGWDGCFTQFKAEQSTMSKGIHHRGTGCDGSWITPHCLTVEHTKGTQKGWGNVQTRYKATIINSFFVVVV
jgi:hypothetical protein